MLTIATPEIARAADSLTTATPSPRAARSTTELGALAVNTVTGLDLTYALIALGAFAAWLATRQGPLAGGGSPEAAADDSPEA